MVLPTKGDGMATMPRPDPSPNHGPDDKPLAIEITALSKVFHRGKGAQVKAVDNLSLAVPAGQVVAFLGPNGAGKTTTIKMLCGLITPTSGSARLNGYDVGRQRPMAVRQIGHRAIPPPDAGDRGAAQDAAGWGLALVAGGRWYAVVADGQRRRLPAARHRDLLVVRAYRQAPRHAGPVLIARPLVLAP